VGTIKLILTRVHVILVYSSQLIAVSGEEKSLVGRAIRAYKCHNGRTSFASGNRHDSTHLHALPKMNLYAHVKH
jgi:hypothetical protein